MYLVGTDRALRREAQRLLEDLSSQRQRLVTDAEVYQEVLHRYRAIDRPQGIQDAFDALDGIVDEVLPVERADVMRAKEILLGRWRIEARDAIHVAIMERHRISRILSFDAAFDSVPGIERITEVLTVPTRIRYGGRTGGQGRMAE